MPTIADRVAESTLTEGLNTINLGGALPGYRTFVEAIGPGVTTYYFVVHRSVVPAQWEVGVGVVVAGSPDTLTRQTVLASSAGGTNKVSFAAGVKDVFVDVPADRKIYMAPGGGGVVLGTSDVPGASAATLRVRGTGPIAVAFEGNQSTGYVGVGNLAGLGPIIQGYELGGATQRALFLQPLGNAVVVGPNDPAPASGALLRVGGASWLAGDITAAVGAHRAMLRELTGANEIPAGAGLTTTTASPLTIYAASATGDVAGKVTIAYYDAGASGWRSALEIGNSPGSGMLRLMRSAGAVAIGPTLAGATEHFQLNGHGLFGGAVRQVGPYVLRLENTAVSAAPGSTGVGYELHARWANPSLSNALTVRQIAYDRTGGAYAPLITQASSIQLATADGAPSTTAQPNGHLWLGGLGGPVLAAGVATGPGAGANYGWLQARHMAQTTAAAVYPLYLNPVGGTVYTGADFLANGPISSSTPTNQATFTHAVVGEPYPRFYVGGAAISLGDGQHPTVPRVSTATNYTILNDNEGRAAVYLGDTNDQGNYYDNTIHHFRSRTTSAVMMRLTLASLAAGMTAMELYDQTSGTIKRVSRKAFNTLGPTDLVLVLT